MNIIEYTKSKVDIIGDVATIYIPDNFKAMAKKFKDSTKDLKKQLNVRKVRFSYGDAVQIKQISRPEFEWNIATEFDETVYANDEMLALDFETTGVDALSCDIISFSLTGLSTGITYYYPVKHNNYNNLSHRHMPEFLNTLGTSKTFVVHNLSFERKLLNRLGVVCSIRDTMILQYLKDSSQPKGLKDIAMKKFNIKMDKFEDVLKAHKTANFADVPIEDAAKYCCTDTWVTAKLYNSFKESDIPRNLDDLDHRVAEACSTLEEAGIRIDLKRLKNFEEYLTKTINKIELKMYELCGEEFNVRSTKQVADIVYGKLGVPTKDYCTTGAGGLSTSESTIKQLVVDGIKHPVLSLLLKHREFSKLLSSYVLTIPEKMNETTGRLHGRLNYTGTDTRRFSASSPNFQNMPASGLGKEIRNCIIPRPGYKFVTADYSQIEIRILAHVMNDPSVIKLLEDGHDMHTATASAIYKTPIAEVTKEQRSRGKTLNFAKIFGQGLTATAKLLSISKEEAQELEEKYYETFPSIKEAIEKSLQECRSNGYVTTLLGGKRWLPDINSSNFKLRSRAERQVFNTKIQGTAAEVARCAMIRINEELLPEYKDTARLVMQVHDEFVSEVREDQVESYKSNLEILMVNPFNLIGYDENLLELNVPLQVDIGVADSYGESK